MSSYWAGYSGTGMVLNSFELNEMLKVYKQKNPNTAHDLDETIEDYGFEEFKFIKSVCAGAILPDLQTAEDNRYEDKVVYLQELSDDNMDGVTFYPFYRSDGTMNITEKQLDGTWRYEESSHPVWADPEDCCYICWSDKDMVSPKAFEEKPYASYQDFVQEFKDKWAAYLPEDFNWDDHLGFISYACYA